MRWYLYVLFFLILAGFNYVNAQQNNDMQMFYSLRSKTIEHIELNTFIKLDTLSIVPGSVIITDSAGNIPGTSDYTIDFLSAEIYWNYAPPTPVYIQYRVFSFDFTQKYRHKDIIESSPSPMSKPEFTYQAPEDPVDIFGSDKNIESSGSLSRGITVGNAQNLALNSELNLQLNGMLNENIGIKAAITDRNIPVQPDGTTLQLQEFDQVFIQLFTETDKLQIGDFLMQSPTENYFLKNNKKAQGLSLSSKRNFGIENANLDNNVSFAMSRGKYSRNTFQGNEGGQGPYRLSAGGANEFVYIISGTEKVFVNGRELIRGEFNDYIINYNTAEITFTSNVPITQNSRIIVEYQYANFNYLRSVLTGSSTVQTNRWTFRVNMYTEQDHKNRPLSGEINENELLLLSQANPDEGSVFTSQFDSSVFNPDRVMYRKIDTLGYSDIFVHSNEPELAVFLVSFTQVGSGKGNYIQSQSLANGRVFEWVPPLNGIPQGNYDPVRVIVAPEKQQLYTLATEFSVTENITAGTELALSNHIANTYSQVSHLMPPAGMAVSTFVNTQHQLSSGTDPWSLSGKIHHEFADQNFKAVERYRAVEFDRTWNRSLRNTPGFQLVSNENLGNLNLRLDKKNLHSLDYKFSVFLRETSFTGVQNEIALKTRLHNFRISLKNEITNVNQIISDTSAINRKFNFKHAELAYLFPFITTGAGYEEETARHQMENDPVLQINSFQYHQYRFFIQNPDTSQNTYLLQFSQRNDYNPIEDDFFYFTKENAIEFRMRYRTLKNNQLNWNIFLRNTEPAGNLTHIEKETTLLNRADYNYSYIDGFFKGRLYYETANGQEQKRDYIFVQVLTGQGTHIWIDYNQNGIKERNEFEPSPFPEEADYVKVPIPTAEYVKSLSNNFNKSFEIDPYKQWNESTGLKKVLSTLVSRTIFQIQRKNLDNESLNQYNPFYLEIDDTLLVTMNSNIRQSLEFNRRNTRFGSSISWFNNRYKQLLVYDIESNQREEFKYEIRWNISRQWSLFPEISLGNITNSSNAVPARNYIINYQRMSGRINYQPNLNIRISGIYEYFTAENIYKEQFDKTQRHHITTEVTYSRAQKSHITIRTGLIFIDFDGESVSPAGFEVLQGYANGTNANWSAQINHQLQKDIQLSFRYDGRQPADSKTIHTGRAMLRYLF